MRELLTIRNQALSRNVEILLSSIINTRIPYELQPYKSLVLKICEQLKDSIGLNQSYLQIEEADILEDVLSATQQITQFVRLLSSHLSVPILRASLFDRLLLRTIRWLHQEHTQTEHFPPAFTSGRCAIYLFRQLPVYLFPSIEQQGLLYQPLLFHEFGHLLYQIHELEMNDLVAEFREEVINLLMPASQRNDRFAEEQASQRQIIADTWYSWIQELFCDAVGFQIGGPGFLHAFSTFLSTLAKGDFYRQPRDLKYSDHPVTWLRVRFLTERASEQGFQAKAKMINQEWRTIAELMGVAEDYHGFYHESLAEIIANTINDMMTEAAPRRCTQLEAEGNGWNPGSDSPIRLLNWAWQIYMDDPARYPEWETERIEALLNYSA